MSITYLNRLFELGETKGMKCGLENVLTLDRALGHPSSAFSSIHVAGTNGKGSVCTKIARVLQNEKRKVGLYTSPHLHSFQERIEIDRKFISKEQAEKHLSRLFQVADQIKIQPTYFEILTLLAFLHFAEEKVEIAVLEVGMGGRWDATNIVTPILSIVTSIDFDHTQYLGTTLDAIAKEKGGIIKPGVPLVAGPQAARIPIFSTLCKEKKCAYHPLLETFDNYEEENRGIARKALEFLPFQELTWQGIFDTPACRFQQFNLEIPVILDVGHNPAAFNALFHRVEKAFPQKKYSVLIALSSDKEIEDSLHIVAKKAAFLHLTEAPSVRAKSVLFLAHVLEKKGFYAFAIEKDLKMAFKKARQRAFLNDEILVVCGTFFIMNSILEIVKEEKALFSCSSNDDEGHSIDEKEEMLQS